MEYDEYYASLDEKTKAKYRTIIFAVETLSFMESKRVLFLNSFLKKSTKQYKGEIEIARKILEKYI